MAFEAHHVPGRVRFKIPGLRDDGTLVLALPRLLQACAGVIRVEVRPASNSLIVHYDPVQADSRALAASVSAGLGMVAGVAVPVKLAAAKVSGTRSGSVGASAARTSATRQPRATGHGDRAATAPTKKTADDRATIGIIRHLGVVFGQTAFKAALEQAVQGGLKSLYRATIFRN